MNKTTENRLGGELRSHQAARRLLEELRRRHNMHTLSGNWRVRYECHVANAGDWLVIWSSNDSVAFFERTGSHDELFR